MPSVILVVFVVQLALHLVNAIGGQMINDLLWTLYTRLPTPQSRDAEQTTKLRRDVVRLNREMNAVSAQDDFAKWARLRRDHDKAKDKYDKQSNTQRDFRTTFDRIVSALRWLGTQGLNFFLNTWFAKQPMFWLPNGWLPYYAEWILCFPRAPIGSISVNVWAVACGSVIGMLSQGVRAGLTLREGSIKGDKIKMEEPAKSTGRVKKEL